MRTIYDPRDDVLFVRLGAAPILESEEVRPGIILDFDAEGRLVGFELHHAAQQLGHEAIVEAQRREVA